MLVRVYIEQIYFPYADSVLAKSTVEGYRKIWRLHSEHFEGITLNVRCADCQGILGRICKANSHLTKTSVSHIRGFFSGIWSHAVRSGYTESDTNPWRDVKLPQAQEPTETHAYSPEEITLMLAALPMPYYLMVLLAACTGLRRSEIRGLQWQDWTPETSTLEIKRAAWRTHLKPTKSKASRAPVPVVPVLAKRLEAYRTGRELIGEKLPKPDAFIFASSTGTAVDLDNVARRFIVPALRKAKLEKIWQGWHAFRRGLATFLHAQGVDDKTIQAILRHENVATTQKAYIKTVPESVRNAMAAVNFGER